MKNQYKTPTIKDFIKGFVYQIRAEEFEFPKEHPNYPLWKEYTFPKSPVDDEYSLNYMTQICKSDTTYRWLRVKV